jgi:hypothetical protein
MYTGGQLEVDGKSYTPKTKEAKAPKVAKAKAPKPEPRVAASAPARKSTPRRTQKLKAA